MDTKPSVIVIAGPTAGGKTRLGVELALALGGEIVNADSMQVYRGMDVGTAKPTLEERQGVVHHLLDVADPDEEFNAARFRGMALPLIRDIRDRAKVCLVVGGTGLYIKGLLEGLFDCPPADQELRRSLTAEARVRGTEALYDALKAVDPASAGIIHPNDLTRIVRALEIHRLTGMPASRVREAHGFRGSTLHALKLYLNVDRDVLYSRIDRRSLDMVRDGLVEETGRLLEKGYAPDLKPMKAIGYRHMVAYLDGACTLEAAIRTLQRDTRRYAKRQMTWFRADPEAKWVRPADTASILNRIERFLRVDL